MGELGGSLPSVSADLHQRHLPAGYAAGDVGISLGGAPLGELADQPSAAGGQDHLGILGHQAQKGRPAVSMASSMVAPCRRSSRGRTRLTTRWTCSSQESWLTTRWASRREEGSLTATTMARSAPQAAMRKPGPRPAGSR